MTTEKESVATEGRRLVPELGVLGEASANLLQPFWMLPTLAILGLKARDIMG